MGLSPEEKKRIYEEEKARIEAERAAAYRYPEGTRAGRIVSSSVTIAFSAVFLVFFNFFSQYLAVYSRETIDGITRWNMYPLLTQEFILVLPILNTTLILSIVGHIVSIILDRYLLREITIIVLKALGVATVLTFLKVFPLGFSMIPYTNVAPILPTVAIVILLVIIVGLGISALVGFIKLMIKVSKHKRHKGGD